MNDEYQHPDFPQPHHPDVALWRYLDYSKFEWLLESKRLFMPSAEFLGEPLEGTEPVGNSIWWREKARLAETDKQREIIQRNQEKLSAFAKAFRNHYYVSCWHMNENENNRMWHEYTKSPESVAVKTTYSELHALLPDYIEIGVVRYIDYENESLPSLNMFEYITHKHSEFCYEREVRAVAFPPAIDELGKAEFEASHFQSEDNSKFQVLAPEIDASRLVKRVLLHPQSSVEFRNRINAMCANASICSPETSIFASNV